MNPGIIVGIGLLLSAVAGFGWQLYDGWLAFSEIASQARDVGWWAQVQAATPLQFLIGCELNPECRAMLHEFVPTQTTVWPHPWKLGSGVAFAGALTLAVSRPKPGKTFGARFAGLRDVRRLVLKDLSSSLVSRSCWGGLRGGCSRPSGDVPPSKARKTQPVLGHVLTVAPSQTGKSYSLAANALYTPASFVLVTLDVDSTALRAATVRPWVRWSCSHPTEWAAVTTPSPTWVPTRRASSALPGS